MVGRRSFPIGIRSIFRGNSLLNFVGVILQLFHSLFLSCGRGGGDSKGAGGQVGPGMIGMVLWSKVEDIAPENQHIPDPVKIDSWKMKVPLNMVNFHRGRS